MSPSRRDCGNQNQNNQDMCLYGSVLDFKALLSAARDPAHRDNPPHPLDEDDTTLQVSAAAPRERLLQRRRSRSNTSVDTNPVRSSDGSISCDECEALVASKRCLECDLVYCEHCNERRHRKGNLKYHTREDLLGIQDQVIMASPENHDEDLQGLDFGEWLSRIHLCEYLPHFQQHYSQNENQDEDETPLTVGAMVDEVPTEAVLQHQLHIHMHFHRRKILSELQHARKVIAKTSKIERACVPTENNNQHEHLQMRHSFSKLTVQEPSGSCRLKHNVSKSRGSSYNILRSP